MAHPTPALVRVGVVGEGLGARYDGHVGEVVNGTLCASSGPVVVRVLSVDATISVDSSTLQPLDPRPVPGAPCMPLQSLGEKWIRRLIAPLMPDPALVDHVLSFIHIRHVSMEDVQVVAASSSAPYDQCDPKHTLMPGCDCWWISSPGSAPNGVGCEFISYQLGDTVRRVSFVRLQIPCLPYGPLSVRIFHLESAEQADGPYTRASPELVTFDTERMQEWALTPPIESRFVRIVCTVNAAAAHQFEDKWHRLSGMRLIEADCIGFFELAFS